MRIGIPLIGGTHWHGGITYLEATIRAFRAMPQDEQPELYLLVDKLHASDLPLHGYILNLLDGFIVIGSVSVEVLPNEILSKVRSIKAFQEVIDHIDVIFPINSNCLPGFPFVSWIPDFQHRALPQLFSETDWVLRETTMNFVMAAAENIVVSSEVVKKDLMQYYPAYLGRVIVVPFFSRFDKEVLEQNPAEIVNRYHLPERYLICCNQFWQHKNHDTLFRAMAQTKYPVNLVCTGTQEDYRNKDWVVGLKSLIKNHGIDDRISLLGFIPRVDQIQLMRRSLGVVQPSLYEGWSTVMEDARGLGKVVIASDLEIHREQAVSNVHYFDPKSPRELAGLLDHVYAKQILGGDAAVELRGQSEVQQRQIDSARKILPLLKSVINAQNTKKNTLTGSRTVDLEMYQTSRTINFEEMVSEKEKEIQSKEKALVVMTQSSKEKEAEIQSKEVEIQSKKVEIQSKEVEIQSKEAEIQSKEVEIQSKEVEIQSKEKALAQMTQSCVEKEAVIQGLIKQLHASSATQIG